MLAVHVGGRTNAFFFWFARVYWSGVSSFCPSRIRGMIQLMKMQRLQNFFRRLSCCHCFVLQAPMEYEEPGEEIDIAS